MTERDYYHRMEIKSISSEQTLAIGQRIGEAIKPGDIIALKGDLGAGKTVLTKGIALALNIKEDVTSPTYNIVCEYSGSMALNHMDLYRIEGIEEFEMLGVDDLMFSDGLTVIEWSERITEYLPDNHITISITRNSEDESRLIKLHGLEI